MCRPLEEAEGRINAMFGVFTHQRRRYALRELRRHDTPMALADLADELAIREHEAPLSDIPAEEVKRLYISLYHRHIPKLVDADLVRYDQERDTVAPTARVDSIEEYHAFLTVD